MKPRITYTSVTGLITPLHHTSTTTWHYDYHTTPTAPHRITTATTTTTTTTTPGPVTQCRPDSRRGSWPGWSHGVIIVVLWWCGGLMVVFCGVVGHGALASGERVGPEERVSKVASTVIAAAVITGGGGGEGGAQIPIGSSLRP
ncbi:uncharacterized protein LOC143021682 isoform X2 [Oratosquilla oratoria]|uniref:uncharacterized protein LOC143021682 isoform X2 n=1 Tax=Oratosquilla oratoria TaxID=337810 RepID=UPI003F775BDA